MTDVPGPVLFALDDLCDVDVEQARDVLVTLLSTLPDTRMADLRDILGTPCPTTAMSNARVLVGLTPLKT